MAKGIAPLSEKKRLEWIDAARGFAILGIFMVNVPAINAPFFQYGGAEDYWDSPIDHFLQIVIDIFFQASFYTLFSFLFGFGIQLIIENVKEKGIHAHTFILRRLFILISFGIIHAFFIWHGDILLSYGTIGLLLLLFINRKSTTLIWWALSLLIIPTVAYTALLYLAKDNLGFVDHTSIQLAFENYGNGSFIDILKQNYRDWSSGGIVFQYIFLTINLLPLFLLGMVTARKKWLHNIEKHSSLLKRFWVITFILFIVLKAGPHIYGNPQWFSLIQDTIGGSASAIFYLLSITLLYQSGKGNRLYKTMTFVGRMSLSNYIFQSIVCFFAFYSVGLGFYGQVSPLKSVIFVVVIYSIQLIISRLWLTKYRFGPLEWLWRSLTYRQKQPMKRKRRGEEYNEASKDLK